MSEVLIATAGLGSDNFRSAAGRVIRGFDRFGYVSRKVLLNEDNLETLCPSVSNKYGNFLNTETRGFGYMAWKAELAYRLLSEYGGEILYFWVDAGCEVSSTRLARFKFANYIHKLGKQEYLYYCLNTPEKDYTKTSLFSYFPTLNSNDCTPQAQTTFFGLHGELGLKIATRWFDVVSSSIHTVNEEDNVSNVGEKVRHRHDQSVFSLVLKEFGLKPNLSPIRSDESKNSSSRILKYLREPIIAARNRSGISWNPLK